MTKKAQADSAAWNKTLLKKYGLTSRQWLLMFDSQGGKCPICGGKLQKPDNPEGKRASAVDHDHKSGRVRGLLDFRCNYRVVRRMTAERAKKISDYLNSSFDGRQL